MVSGPDEWSPCVRSADYRTKPSYLWENVTISELLRLKTLYLYIPNERTNRSTMYGAVKHITEQLFAEVRLCQEEHGHCKTCAFVLYKLKL
jgi:hypothetical protein